MLVAARDAGVRRFVYAASSSTYGDRPALPKVEDVIGRPLSPYAVTKYLNELYADVFGRCYGMATIGLRYFNVFGPRQDPDGAYAAVIPRWVGAMLRGRAVRDQRRRRDHRATSATSTTPCRPTCSPRWSTSADALGQVYNVAVGDRTTLLQLHDAVVVGAARTAAGPVGAGRRPLPSSAPATCATRWPTSARRARCSAMNPATTCARACAKRLAGTSET